MSCFDCLPEDGKTEEELLWALGVGEGDDDLDFVAWRDAAIQCLPEHVGTVAEALSLIGAFPKANLQAARKKGDDPARKARRVSKQKADEEIGKACMSWDNPFYVLAVGRGSPSGLRADAVAGLLALLVGHKPTNMHLTEAALLSLARIFAGSKDLLISKRICEIWENHENADVRNDALLAIYLIGNMDIVRYALTMRDIMVSTSRGWEHATSLWRLCTDSKVQPERQLDWPHTRSILTSESSAKYQVTLFALLRLRIASDKDIEACVSVTELSYVLVKYVLAKPLSRRLALQSALCFVESHSDLFFKLPASEREIFLDAVAELAQMSVFKEVRKAATATLKKFDDVRAEIALLLRSCSIDPKAKKDSMLAKYPGLRPNEAEDSGVVGVFRRNYGGSFANYLRACRNLKGCLWMQAPDSTEYPGIVALYYLLLQVDDVPGEAISDLLASRRFMLRTLGLVHIAVTQRLAFRGQVLHLKVHDPFKDVRSCAAHVLELLPGPKEVSNSKDRMLELHTELLERERLNLVLDLEFITAVQDESEVGAWLKTLLKNPAT